MLPVGYDYILRHVASHGYIIVAVAMRDDPIEVHKQPQGNASLLSSFGCYFYRFYLLSNAKDSEGE